MFSRNEYINDPVLQTQEKQVQELFENDKPIVIFDIGACEGESSIRYSRIFQVSSIYTFEPIPANFQRIEENIKHFQTTQIHPFQLCLSDTNGEADFYVSSAEVKNTQAKDWDYGNKSSSLLAPEKTLDLYNWLEFKEKVTVKTQTLEHFCQVRQIFSIDFVHLDVQGAELLVLAGAGNLPIQSMWLEVERVALYKNQPLKKETEHFMQAKGFIKIIDTVNHISGDQFWVQKNLLINKKGADFYKKIQYQMAVRDLKN
ncbi:MAG: FkbM family methyltransferase, partial [Verrucomicrobia bacterium]|nr:FkbM family methyltransferase [Cytophagales bacterium]